MPAGDASPLTPAQQEARRRIVELAERMVAGELELLEGCRAIVEQTGSLTPEDDRDDDVLTLVVVESELDHVPYPSARQYWYPVALAEKDQQAASYIARMRDEILRACNSLIVKWGRR